jgi:hypothetical protein
LNRLRKLQRLHDPLVSRKTAEVEKIAELQRLHNPLISGKIAEVEKVAELQRLLDPLVFKKIAMVPGDRLGITAGLRLEELQTLHRFRKVGRRSKIAVLQTLQ